MAATLEEISAEVRHVRAHLFKQGKSGCCRFTEVHAALVDVREHHLLVKIVHTTGVVADVGGNRVILCSDEVDVCSLIGLGVQYRLQNGVWDFCLRTAHNEGPANINIGVVVDKLWTGVGASRAR